MNMELKLMKDYVLIREEENPYIQRKTSSGIITTSGGAFESEESGEMEQLNRIIGFGIVINHGPDVKYVAKGDGVYYDRRSMRALPFGSEPGWHINESNLLGYVTDENGSVANAVQAMLDERAAEARKAAFTIPAGFGSTGDGRIIH